MKKWKLPPDFCRGKFEVERGYITKEKPGKVEDAFVFELTRRTPCSGKQEDCNDWSNITFSDYDSRHHERIICLIFFPFGCMNLFDMYYSKL